MPTLKHQAVMSAAKVVYFAAVRLRQLAEKAREPSAISVAKTVIDAIESIGNSR